MQNGRVINRNLFKLDIVLILYLFLWLFDPPLIKNFSFEPILTIYSIIYVVLNYGYAKVAIAKSRITIFIKGYLLYFIYGVVITGLNFLFRNDVNLTSAFLNTFIGLISYGLYIIAIGLFVTTRSQKKGYDFYFLIKMIIFAASIQAVLVIASFLSSDIKNYFIQIMSTNISSSNKISTYVTDISGKRNFGFAYSLYDMFGYVTSIMFITTFNYALYRNKLYFIISGAIFMMPLLNSRTGLLLSVLGLIISLLLYLIYSGKATSFLKVLFSLLILSYLLSAVFNLIQLNAPTTYTWMKEGIDSTIALITEGEVTGGYYTNASMFWFFPTDLSIIFGTGLTPKDLINTGSDVGYVNVIWKFGIVGLLIVIALYTKLLKTVIKTSDSGLKKAIGFYLIFSVLIYMVKLDVVKASPGAYIMFLLCFIILYDNHEKNTNKT
ncbi:hypothetical protein [Oceanobacillus saliphilus]|uniref:hypothetical protein n=1 Tax=Oceanobacillus saliphilus TaxID=2925834 RepID=UPI00201E4AE5|nr:hypothetical protein [Oceanobacillus saliphilus]